RLTMKATDRLIVRSVLSLDLDKLAAEEREPSSDTPDDYLLLRRAALLSAPRGSSVLADPRRGAAERRWLADALYARWIELSAAASSTDVHPLRHYVEWLSVAGSESPASVALSAELVRGLRPRLRSRAQHELAIEWLEETVAREGEAPEA